MSRVRKLHLGSSFMVEMIIGLSLKRVEIFFPIFDGGLSGSKNRT